MSISTSAPIKSCATLITGYLIVLIEIGQVIWQDNSNIPNLLRILAFVLHFPKFGQIIFAMLQQLVKTILSKNIPAILDFTLCYFFTLLWCMTNNAATKCLC